MTYFDWTGARDAMVLHMWDDGQSASAIGLEIGTTKNSVLGRLRRLGAEQRRLPPSTLGGMANRAKGKKRREAASALRKARPPAEKPERIDYGRGNPNAPKAPPIALDGDVWSALPGTSPVGLLGLTGDTCRWPIGERPFTFCGLPPTDGSRYCATHHAKAFSSPKGVQTLSTLTGESRYRKVNEPA
jgi:GcrA cell cycle regulator